MNQLPRRSILETATPYIIVASFPAYFVLDYLLYRFGTNRATISWAMLLTSLRSPMVLLALSYSWGVLIRHCGFPVVGESPSLGEVIGRVAFVMSPLFYAVAKILDQSGPANAKTAYESYGGFYAVLALIGLSFVVGLLAGYLLPQHIGVAENLEDLR